MPEHYNGPYPRPKSVVKSHPEQRVSEAERQAVVEQLRLNTAEGRLDIEEFGERVEKALAARTGAELTPLLHDLVHIEAPNIAAQRRRHQVVMTVVPYVAVNALLVAIWAATGITSGFGYFWPIWPIIGWGFVVALALWRIAGYDSRHHIAQLGPGPQPPSS